MKSLHSYWAYLVLALLVLATLNAVIGFVQKKSFQKKDYLLGLFTIIASHTQLLIGLGWYFSSPYYQALKDNGMGEVMKNSGLRLIAVEHPTTMIISLILITIGWSKHKKQSEDQKKFKSFVVFFTAGLILMLVRIPWQQWF